MHEFHLADLLERALAVTLRLARFDQLSLTLEEIFARP